MSPNSSRLLITTLTAVLALSGCQNLGLTPGTTSSATDAKATCKQLGVDTTTAAAVGAVGGAVIGREVGGNSSKTASVGRRNGMLVGALAGAVAGVGVAKVTQTADGAAKLTVPGNVQFPTGSYQLTPEFKKALDGVASTIKEYCGVSARVVGHTDSVGTLASNQVLSEKRAQAVVDYLSTTGDVNVSRLSVEGMSSTQPVATNDTADGRHLNRRVEIFLKSNL